MAGHRVLLVMVVVYPLINGELNNRQLETDGNTSISTDITAAASIVPAPITISTINKTTISEDVSWSTASPKIPQKAEANRSAVTRKNVAKIKKRSSFLIKAEQYKYAHLRHVKRCPKVAFTNPIDVPKILGFWYAYATTPMAHPLFRLECSSYDASNYNFTNIILTTDYINFAVLFYCIPNKKKRRFDITIRVLTRNSSPTQLVIRTIKGTLTRFHIDVNILVWLQHKAYCFEWFIRSNHDRRRHYRYLAPYNRWNAH
ncbi:uncharacterized protein LOC111070354 [Drosophila obscura]|uniref:uncharacterized protein LOC111070354 n=1 Tax=Drosophila obscura TaxID=7282 RepID=UPI001BB265B2|nr:uncharacterized protein LOC111070354 [Drosophila obscura]